MYLNLFEEVLQISITACLNKETFEVSILHFCSIYPWPYCVKAFIQVEMKVILRVMVG